MHQYRFFLVIDVFMIIKIRGIYGPKIWICVYLPCLRERIWLVHESSNFNLARAFKTLLSLKRICFIKFYFQDYLEVMRLAFYDARVIREVHENPKYIKFSIENQQFCHFDFFFIWYLLVLLIFCSKGGLTPSDICTN